MGFQSLYIISWVDCGECETALRAGSLLNVCHHHHHHHQQPSSSTSSKPLLIERPQTNFCSFDCLSDGGSQVPRAFVKLFVRRLTAWNTGGERFAVPYCDGGTGMDSADQKPRVPSSAGDPYPPSWDGAKRRRSTCTYSTGTHPHKILRQMRWISFGNPSDHAPAYQPALGDRCKTQ